MAWGVTAETGRFDEAVDFFRAKVPYTFDQLGALDDKARANAFWIAGGVELAAVRGIFDELGKAIEKGTSLQDFKRDIRAKLPGAIRDQHLTVVFRNAVQTALNAGRWQQMTEPDVKRFRPYWMYDAILDSRTSSVCRRLNGTIKSADDEFWLTRWPPLHHACRSSVRSLRRSEALRRGITQGVPEGEPQGGFGAAPITEQAEPPKPNVTKLDPQVHDAYRARKQKMERELEEAQRKARERREREKPEYWLDREHRAKYGEDAGRAVAWGRAAEERGLATSLEDARRRYYAITEDIGVSLSRNPRDLFSRIKTAAEDGFISGELKSLGDVVTALEKASQKTPSLSSELHEARALAAILGHQSGISKAGKRVKLAPPKYDSGAPEAIRAVGSEVVDKVQKFWAELGDKSLELPDKSRGYKIRWSDGRAFFDNRMQTVYTAWKLDRSGNLVDTGFSTAVHEMAHGLEHYDARARRAAHEFLERRTNNLTDPLRKLNELFKNSAYGDEELTREDEFFHPYMGKEYVSWVTGERTGTEVTSMAMEYLHRDAAKLLREDPDTFYFALGQLAGDSR